MPMIWTSEADAKLMAKILQIADVKLTGAQMKKLADAMGDGCTPKAVSHRLTHYRKLAVKTTSSTSTKPPSSTRRKTIKPAKVTKPKVPTKRKKTPPPTLRTSTPGPTDEDDEDAPLTPSATAPRGRGKGKADDDDSDDDGDEYRDNSDRKEWKVEGLNDDVRIEVGEDIGEGLRESYEDVDEF